MSDLISRDAILKHIEKTRQSVQKMDDIQTMGDLRKVGILMNGMYLLEEAVMNQPSSQPERKKGRWLAKSFHEVYCDKCGFDFDIMKNEFIDKMKYCPNCGSDNREESDNG